ncbi:hypothetical protein EW146_g3004 [Bondarzewia mesenterica]|uniref:Cytochrome b5 heme-binding domain-containing protein n=1 Tax=Bondarzewia mesenterica TaxID=1095465 RepID=A0A4S4M0S0_9AGAM|nr:hypothetical protein EW146_g3004 [Bondarzewia mesenterica]
MTSYLRSWLSPSSSVEFNSNIPSPNAILTISAPNSDNDDGFSDKVDDEDEAPPAFPALSSAQLIQNSSSTLEVPRILTDRTLMPPPPPPLTNRRDISSRLGVPTPSSGSSLMPPPTTTKIPTLSAKKREKVALAPGHSPLDWAILKSSGADLRGGAEQLMRITPSMLKQHNKPDDAWSAFNGRVYNITPYLPFHPGGEKELMRVAGRDGTKLFALTHAWVNVDFMLDACFVGFLVRE